MSPDPAPPTVTYWAVSIITSRTAQFALVTFLLGILSLPSTLAIIPLRYMPLLLCVVGILNFILRKFTVRPVAFIAPGSSSPIQVTRIDPPPAPPVTTD